MFSSTGTDITTETKLLTVTFTIGSGVKNVTLDTDVTAIGTETVADADAEIIPCIKAIERDPVFKVQVKK